MTQLSWTFCAVSATSPVSTESCRYLKASSGRLSRSLNSSSAAGGVDELALGLVERHGLERRGQRLRASGPSVIWRSPASTLSCGPMVTAPDAVAARDEVALDLDVLEHLGVRAVVRGEQRLEDLLALVRELAAQDPLVGRLGRRRARSIRRRRGAAARSALGMRKSGWSRTSTSSLASISSSGRCA